MKVLKIEEVRPSVKLPDGNYFGTQGGYNIVIKHNNSTYNLTTDEGIRGVGFKVVVCVDGPDITILYLKN